MNVEIIETFGEVVAAQEAFVAKVSSRENVVFDPEAITTEFRKEQKTFAVVLQTDFFEINMSLHSRASIASVFDGFLVQRLFQRFLDFDKSILVFERNLDVLHARQSF